MVEGQKGNAFARAPLTAHLDACLNKTLGELDVCNAFRKADGNPKVTGIAGDVIEQSVLFLKSNSKQAPDIEVDHDQYEVKTTGLRESKKDENELEAKEPMSITAVSPNTIVKEKYRTSAFWHKVEHMLLFYYKYASKTVVPASEYRKFPLLAYQFHEYSDFSEDEQKTLENDWVHVRNFIIHLQNTVDDYESEYGQISHVLRKDLLLLDTAPKWPSNPRFRFKRTFVTSIYRKYVEKKPLAQLPESFNNNKELEEKCDALQTAYHGWTVGELCVKFGIKAAKGLKSITEPIIIRMFGGTAKKMQDVEFFNKVGIWGKSFVITKDGRRTEDAKFFRIRFDEFLDEEVTFENSQFYDFFATARILVAVFEEPSAKAPLDENRFLHFRMITFDDAFIDDEVRPVWEKIRDLVRNKTLKDLPILNADGTPKRNKNGEVSSAPNLPKSSEGIVFVRGTGVDSSDKRECVNGVRMYCQQVWIKGSYLAELVNQPF